jgi:hypothetical protein
MGPAAFVSGVLVFPATASTFATEPIPVVL